MAQEQEEKEQGAPRQRQGVRPCVRRTALLLPVITVAGIIVWRWWQVRPAASRAQQRAGEPGMAQMLPPPLAAHAHAVLRERAPCLHRLPRPSACS